MKIANLTWPCQSAHSPKDFTHEHCLTYFIDSMNNKITCECNCHNVK